VDGGMSEVVYLLEIGGEHVRVLIIFGRDVALDGFGDGDIVSTTEGKM
jgi:hypothetical protein